MAITSVSKLKYKFQLRNVQVRYALLYAIITFLAMLLLNIYCSKTSMSLFYSNKESLMIEKCRLASSEIASLDVLNENTVEDAILSFENLNVTRLIVTNQNGMAIFDSYESHNIADQYMLYPEIVTALEGNDVFYWNYSNRTMTSVATTPVYSYGTLIGCVYIMENDTTQSTIIATLQNTIFLITLILEIVVIFSSFASAHTYSRRLRKILNSIRIVRKGDYTHKLNMKGHDELNTLSDEFNDLIARLQVSESKRSQFVSDASHELKTPLASIKLLSDSILQNKMDPETINEFVGDIGNEAERLNRMSQKLLTLSRIDAQEPSELEIVYFTPTIERVVRMLSEIANDKQVRIVTDLRHDTTILITEDDLYQIVFNLVENGIKYNSTGGNLSIILSRKDDQAILEISDTGVGIPEEALEHIFERFYRVDKARSRSAGGSGLGLSIVRNMVERNHGTICVSSEVGKGTAFTLSFPVFDVTEDAQ